MPGSMAGNFLLGGGSPDFLEEFLTFGKTFASFCRGSILSLSSIRAYLASLAKKTVGPGTGSLSKIKGRSGVGSHGPAQKEELWCEREFRSFLGRPFLCLYLEP